jgi:uncharacterized protein
MELRFCGGTGVMSDAFREQLLKAGLATKKQAKAAAHEENVSRRKRRKKKKGDVEASPDCGAAQAALEEKRGRDLELNRQRDVERAARARQAEAEDLIARNGLKDTSGEFEYRFSDGGPIKTLSVTSDLRNALAEGGVGIARAKEGYRLIPRETALMVEERSPDHLVLLNEPDGPADDEDPYAAYKVPDDLIW